MVSIPFEVIFTGKTGWVILGGGVGCIIGLASGSIRVHRICEGQKRERKRKKKAGRYYEERNMGCKREREREKKRARLGRDVKRERDVKKNIDTINLEIMEGKERNSKYEGGGQWERANDTESKDPGIQNDGETGGMKPNIKEIYKRWWDVGKIGLRTRR